MTHLLIPAAGRGTRFYDLGKKYNKCILPYKGVPILIHNIRKIRSHIDLTSVTVVVNHNHDQIRDLMESYAHEMDEIPVNIVQSNPNQIDGPGFSLFVGLQEIKKEGLPTDEPVLIVLGDVAIPEVVPKDIFITKDGAKIGYIQVSGDLSRWCIGDDSSGTVVFDDKPNRTADSAKALSGLYVLPNLLDACDAFFAACAERYDKKSFDTELQISHGLSRLSVTDLIEFEPVDLGTLELYIQNRGVPKSRSFNKISMGQKLVKKSSQKLDKIYAEYEWFKRVNDSLELHPTLKLMTPRVFHKENSNPDGSASYIMEKVPGLTLREISLFQNMDEGSWIKIFEDISSFVSGVQKAETSLQEMNAQRWLLSKVDGPHEKEFSSEYGKCMGEWLDESRSNFDLLRFSLCSHGDLVFSNIIYDPHSSRTVLIDPRGSNSCFLYDIAKLYQSVYTDYDLIDAELYRYDDDSESRYVPYSIIAQRNTIRRAFRNHVNEKVAFGITLTKSFEKVVLYTLAANLHSMIPYHDHSPTNQEIYYRMFLRVWEAARKNDITSLVC